MPTKSWVHFKEGDQVKISCYQAGCENISIPATLGEEYEIHPTFIQCRGVGRLRWSPHARAKGFIVRKPYGEIDRYICPRCQTLFGKVIVISKGRGSNPIIFGYDPDPA